MQLEALEVLSPHQTAELLLLPLPVPPEKDDVINRVFDFLTESPEERKLPEVLLHLVNMSQEVLAIFLCSTTLLRPDAIVLVCRVQGSRFRVSYF